MIESLDPLMAGERVTVYGDLAAQMITDGSGDAWFALVQGADVVMVDPVQFAHLRRLVEAMFAVPVDLVAYPPDRGV